MPLVLFVLFSCVVLLGSLALTAVFSLLYEAEAIPKDAFYLAGAFVLIGAGLVAVSVRLLRRDLRGQGSVPPGLESEHSAGKSRIIAANEEARIAAPWVLPVACFPLACLVLVALIVTVVRGAAPFWAYPAIGFAALIPLYIATVRLQMWRYGSMRLWLSESPVVLGHGFQGELSLGQAVVAGNEVDVDLACVKSSWQLRDPSGAPTGRRRNHRYTTDIWNARDRLPAVQRDHNVVVKLSLQFPQNIPATSQPGAGVTGPDGDSRERHRWELRVDMRPAGRRMYRTFRIPVVAEPSIGNA